MPRLFQRFLCVAAILLGVFAAAPLMAADDAPVQKASFLQMILQGMEWPGWIIGAMSMAAVTIVIEHFWTIRRVSMAPADEVAQTRELIEARKFKECLEYVRNRKSMFADVLTAGLRHGRHGFEAMHEAADERAGAWSSRLFRRVEYLNIIGHLGPLMGLLGTVLGMMIAFGQMKVLGGAYKPDDLAGGISLALVNTFLGLSVAIVSLGFFGICRNRVDSLTVAAHAEVIDILEYFRPAPTGPGIEGVSPPAPSGISAQAAPGMPPGPRTTATR